MKNAPNAPKPEKDKPIPSVVIAPGSTDYYGPLPKREKLWTVRWQSAQVDIADKNSYGGTLKGVTGTIYEGGQEADTFSGDTGHAEKSPDGLSDKLLLYGNVKINVKKPKGTLFCDQLVYDGNHKIIHASGNVRYIGDIGSMSSTPEIVATPDLSKIATPDMFDTP